MQWYNFKRSNYKTKRRSEYEQKIQKNQKQTRIYHSGKLHHRRFIVKKQVQFGQQQTKNSHLIENLKQQRKQTAFKDQASIPDKPKQPYPKSKY